jgi:regulator of sigma E protease
MITIIAFVFVLGMLVFVHELGHFIVAKKSGIRVERFSLGFPPKLIGKKIGDTEYMIGVVPLGGYVKMTGENVTEDDYVPQPGDFMSASVFKRTMVILAGPLMNFVLAIFLFFVVYWSTGSPEMKPNSTEIGVVSPGGPAEKAGIKEGSNIVSIDGNTFKDFTEMAAYVRVRPNSDINISWIDSGKTVNATVRTMSIPGTDTLGRQRTEGRIGIGPVYDYKPISPWQALKDGFSANLFITGQMFSVIWKLVSRQESIKALGGPVLIAQQAGAAARQGFAALLGLAAFLSVNLAIVNILPIPVLDGGHLVFLAIEAFKKRPVSLKGRLIAQQIGMGLLFLLMIVVTYNDIIRLITGIIR